ncbi:MAG: hypothetical protein ABIZ72_11755 [Candidatus Limnocylindrales bacterium]
MSITARRGAPSIRSCRIIATNGALPVPDAMKICVRSSSVSSVNLPFGPIGGHHPDGHVLARLESGWLAEEENPEVRQRLSLILPSDEAGVLRGARIDRGQRDGEVGHRGCGHSTARGMVAPS